MFTGIIEATGEIDSIEVLGEDLRLGILAPNLDLSDVQLGDSIAHDGVCLTVIAIEGMRYFVDVSRETLRCTVGLDQPKRLLNLEKALRLSDRLGGHLVAGHVDGVGKVVRFESLGDCWALDIEVPRELTKFFANKASAVINGVSLTTNRVEQQTLSINLIPHTLEKTNLQFLKVGDAVNLEVDLIARYVERLLSTES